MTSVHLCTVTAVSVNHQMFPAKRQDLKSQFLWAWNGSQQLIGNWLDNEPANTDKEKSLQFETRDIRTGPTDNLRHKVPTFRCGISFFSLLPASKAGFVEHFGTSGRSLSVGASFWFRAVFRPPDAAAGTFCRVRVFCWPGDNWETIRWQKSLSVAHRFLYLGPFSRSKWMNDAAFVTNTLN